MAKRLFVLLACLALLGTVGCRQADQEEAATAGTDATTAADTAYDEAKQEAQKAFMEAETFDEKLALARQFLERFPQTEDLPDIVGLIGDAAVEHERIDDAFAFADWSLAQAEDADVRFATRIKLIELYGKLGRKDELRALVAELGDERELRYRDLHAVVGAAIEAEDWELAVEQSEASLAYASPAHYKEDSPDVSDDDAQRYGTRRVAHSLAYKGWAQFHLGRAEEAFATFARASESTDYGFLGVDSTLLQSYRGQALLRHGEPEKAMEVLATAALYGTEDAALEAYRQAYSACHEDETGFEEHLWSLRQRLAKPIPDFALPNYDGETVRLSDFEGEVVLLAFWFPT